MTVGGPGAGGPQARLEREGADFRVSRSPKQQLRSGAT